MTIPNPAIVPTTDALSEPTVMRQIRKLALITKQNLFELEQLVSEIPGQLEHIAAELTQYVDENVTNTIDYVDDSIQEINDNLEYLMVIPTIVDMEGYYSTVVNIECSGYSALNYFGNYWFLTTPGLDEYADYYNLSEVNTLSITNEITNFLITTIEA